MGIKLSGEQLAELELAKNAGDRIAYYTLLADLGAIYGKLALAVVNNADANNYVRLEGVSIASLQANDFVFA